LPPAAYPGNALSSKRPGLRDLVNRHPPQGKYWNIDLFNNVMKDPPLLLWIVLSNLIAAFALCAIYGKWARGYHSMGGGFQFGIWIGIFMGLGVGLLWYGTTELMDLQGHLVEAVLDIIYYGIVGMVIGLMFRATQPKEKNA